MCTQLIIYRSAWYYLKEGLYFQAWIMLAAQAKRAMCRRKHYLVNSCNEVLNNA